MAVTNASIRKCDAISADIGAIFRGTAIDAAAIGTIATITATTTNTDRDADDEAVREPVHVQDPIGDVTDEAGAVIAAAVRVVAGHREGTREDGIEATTTVGDQSVAKTIDPDHAREIAAVVRTVNDDHHRNTQKKNAVGRIPVVPDRGQHRATENLKKSITR